MVRPNWEKTAFEDTLKPRDQDQLKSFALIYVFLNVDVQLLKEPRFVIGANISDIL